MTVTADDFGVTAVTDAGGRYVLSLPSERVKGPVKVTAALAGFQTRSAMVNAAGGDATQDFSLRVSFGEQITVGRGSSGVDLNAIPAAAIENIEILRDGAAARYGYDAAPHSSLHRRLQS